MIGVKRSANNAQLDDTSGVVSGGSQTIATPLIITPASTQSYITMNSKNTPPVYDASIVCVTGTTGEIKEMWVSYLIHSM